MEENAESNTWRLIGLAYTGDVDISVAGYGQIEGFGSFDLPISGNLSAIVGQNGSGKSRFLQSLGKQTELLFSMPAPTTPKEHVGRALHIPWQEEDEEDARQLGLWGLDSRPSGGSHDAADRPWLTPLPFDDDEFGTRMIWRQQPRDRFKRFRSILRAPRGKPPWTNHSSSGEKGTDRFHENDVVDRFAQEIWQSIVELDRSWRINAAHAATALYPFDHFIGTNKFEDLIITGAGVELAKQSIISLTGCETQSDQKLRFWFEADWHTNPCLTALVACPAHDELISNPKNVRTTSRIDLMQSATIEKRQIVLEIEDFENMCWASTDHSGFLSHTGSPRHYSPLLPLRLTSMAAVTHEAEPGGLWLEGLSAPPEFDSQARNVAAISHPYMALGAAGGSCSWTPRTWFDGDMFDYAMTLGDNGEYYPVAVMEQPDWSASLVTGNSFSNLSVSTFTFSDDVLEFLSQAVEAVNLIAKVILPAPPTALADLSTGVLRWRYVKSGSPPQNEQDTLSLEDLSFAEQRWMKFANLIAGRFLDRVLRELGDERDVEWASLNLLSHAGGTFPGTPWIVTIDEPEAGLHPTAVDRLARGLEALGTQLGVHFVLATHSPNVLKVVQGAQGLIAHAHLNNRGERVFEAIDSARLNEFAGDLGLNPIDILQMTSTFLLVEGEHDRIVINNIIGDDIKRAGVVITPLRGALKVSQIVDSDILWRFTDARLVLVLDSIDADQFQKILQSAKNLVGTGDLDAAIDALEPLKRDRSDKGKTEREALYGLLRSAVTSRRIDRLEIFGLKEPDIIDYFHPSELGNVDPGSHYVSMSRREAWDALHKDYMQTPKKERTVDFKSWAVAKLGLNDSPTQVLHSASENLDRIPDDFNNLRELLCSLSPTERHAD